ncbi:MAG: hypothetical protein KBS75_09180 [Bacteroidales bacterium]|nr:hypothetical protein [Candidatus Equimonas faecalis]
MADYLVRYEFPNGLYYDFRMNGNAKLAPHFKLYELANTKGKTTIPQFVFNEKVWNFLECVEEFRVWYNKSINPTSCYRQVQFNKNCGGDSLSLHLIGLAMDWKCVAADRTDSRRKEIENQWKVITMKHGIIGGCNWYTGGFHFSAYENERFGYTNFVHRDYRGTSSDWK